MCWFSELSSRKHGDIVNMKGNESSSEPKKSKFLGILAFETARTMSKLLSLYKSLSDEEISRLTIEVMRSQGIGYLNSMDPGILMSLACAERLEDLDKTATVVARFGQKSRDFGLNRFDLVYTDLKLGIVDVRKLVYGSKEIQKIVHKMERLIGETSNLYSSLETLTELEMSERKLNQWKDKAPMQPKANVSLFKHKLELQRKHVHHLRETSLWSKTFDKSVGLMARVVCFVYARICAVFSPYVPSLSSCPWRNIHSSHQNNDNSSRGVHPEFWFVEPMLKEQILSHSGSMPSTNSKSIVVRFYSQKSHFYLHEDDGFGARSVTKNNKVFHAAGPSTVGGSGLALRYANVILLAEKCLDSGESIGPDTRESLYQMLPENIKSLVKSKLSKNMKCTEDDELLAEGWREALQGILGWLAPMADDTMQWHLERNPDKMKFESKPPVLLVQTLHFSDKEKTEAAIVEVLVSLSCIFKHENGTSCEP